MKSLKWILPLVAISIMLGGCPYNSLVPLDKPSIKINPALVSTWGADSSDTYKIVPVDDYTFQITETEKTDDSTKLHRLFKGYLSAIGGDTFLNLWSLDTSVISYSFYRIKVSNKSNEITLSAVTDNIRETFKTPEEQKAYFRKYKDLSFFYEKEDMVLKIK